MQWSCHFLSKRERRQEGSLELTLWPCVQHEESLSHPQIYTNFFQLRLREEAEAQPASTENELRWEKMIEDDCHFLTEHPKAKTNPSVLPYPNSP